MTAPVSMEPFCWSPKRSNISFTFSAAKCCPLLDAYSHKYCREGKTAFSLENLCCNLLIFPQISDAVHWHSTANDENINRLSEQSHNICLLLAEALKLQIYVMLCFYKISSPLYVYFTASFQFSLISVNITPQ